VAFGQLAGCLVALLFICPDEAADVSRLRRRLLDRRRVVRHDLSISQMPSKPIGTPPARFAARLASPKICEIQFNTITLIAGKCSPTRFFDSCPGFLAKLYIFLMMDGIFTVKHVHQDLMTEMKPHPAELGFASP
jgi:hypothetical protein